MKLLIIILTLFISSTVFSQTYDLKDYPNGTTTVESLKSQYTTLVIRNMLDNAELCRKNDEKNRFGMKLQDPNTLKNILISDTDSTLMLFEYIKKLRLEIVNLKQRLQTAGIP